MHWGFFADFFFSVIIKCEGRTKNLHCNVKYVDTYLIWSVSQQVSAVLFKWLGTCTTPKCAHYCFKCSLDMVLIFEIPHLGIFVLAKD